MYVLPKHSVFIAFIFVINAVTAQNLVMNPSFEDFVNCPNRLGSFDTNVTHWNTPTDGSTDYFNACSTAMGTPKNFNGSQPADFGKGYAGLYFYAPENYREYLQAELSQTLVKGKKYQVSFYVSLAERSDFAVKEFGVLFSKDKIEVAGKKELSKTKRYTSAMENYNFMEIGYSNFYRDTKDWILVNTQFVAKGTEKYMTIGNFKTNARTRMFKTKRNARQGAYYYVDMFRVAGANEKFEIEDDITASNETIRYTLDKTHVFENILFDFDKYRLLDAGKNEIKKILQYINTDASLQITISGHTDTIGSVAYNQSLSTKRAHAVATYLKSLGLESNRVVWNGLGSEKPIASNNTEDGRRQNRRVEFLITKKGELNK